MPRSLLQVRGLLVEHPVGHGHHAGAVRAVDGVDLDLDEGEVLALVGGPGSGRSGILRAITRLVEPAAGSITLAGEEVAGLGGELLRRLRGRVGLTFSDPAAAFSPRRHLADSVREPLDAQGRGTPEDRAARVAGLLAEVGLKGAGAELPLRLDAVGLARAGIARAVACEPALLLLDEPLAALEPGERGPVIGTLARVLQARPRMGCLLTAADLDSTGGLARRVAVLHLGRVVEEGPPERLLAGPCHPATAAILAGERSPIRADAAAFPASAAGCRFRTRCPRAAEACWEAAPPLDQVAPGRRAACWFPLEPG